MNTQSQAVQIANDVTHYAHSNYDLSTLWSLINSLSDEVKEILLTSEDNDAVHHVLWGMEYNANTNEDAVLPPKYGTIQQTIENFKTKGSRQNARKELRIRLPYMSYAEQEEIIRLMVDGAKIDRQWICQYLRKNWDDVHLPTVISLFEKYKEREAAFLVVKHASIEYVQEHEQELIVATSYLQVRLRYPSSAPINKELLSADEILYLFAKQNIDFEKYSKYANINDTISNVILAAYHNAYRYGRPYEGFLSLPAVRRLNWCLSQLHQTSIILQIIKVERFTLLHADDEDADNILYLIENSLYDAK